MTTNKILVIQIIEIKHLDVDVAVGVVVSG
jgi:hypothetical protein